MKKQVLIYGIAALMGILTACGGTEQPAETAAAETASAAEEDTQEEESVTEETEPETEDPKLREEEYKSQCRSFDYKEYFRNDKKHMGETLMLEFQVAQVMEDSCRGYDAAGNEYVVIDERAENEDKFRIMEEDQLTVYGEYAGVEKITRAIGDYDEDVFTIRAKYITLNDGSAGAAEAAGETAAAALVPGTAASGSSDFILPESSEVHLTESDIAGLSKEELRLARNEIYARHGRIFTSDDLNEYFHSQSWYNGRIPADQFDESVLTDVEKDNLKLIQAAENGGSSSSGKLTDTVWGLVTERGVYRYGDGEGNTGEVRIDSTGVNISFWEAGVSHGIGWTMSAVNDEEYWSEDGIGSATAYFDDYGRQMVLSFNDGYGDYRYTMTFTGMGQ